MSKTKLVQSITDLLKIIKEHDDSRIVFSKVFGKYAEEQTPTMYNNVYNSATMYLLGWSRAAMYIEDITDALNTFDEATLNEVHKQLEDILELL